MYRERIRQGTYTLTIGFRDACTISYPPAYIEGGKVRDHGYSIYGFHIWSIDRRYLVDICFKIR